MATLQKFKHLAIQCGGGASQRPTRSPAVPLRRGKTTLRMLLSRRHRRESTLRRECLLEKTKGEDRVRRHSLKDLFKSAPPGREDVTNEDRHISGSAYEPGSPKHASTGFRYRSLLSSKAWRPILLSITE
ncbi:hypothetical protein VNO78_09471 [Psophocarpus tetragonolobus]|uniref:Uncharacterized protein n=1 Tax=Psophocarpus tetragonolobus TaxID=3891 RepID=A0AAN9SW81_PSOTE